MARGKSLLTPTQLTQRKTEMLKLCLAFPYAVKHYLREEDGLNWDDYVGVLPQSFLRIHDPRTRTTSTASSTRKNSYNATDVLASPVESGSESVERGIGRAADVEREYAQDTPTATKRVRVKRSKDKMPTARTALLSTEYQTVDFNPLSESTIPLPLTYVFLGDDYLQSPTERRL